VSQDGTFVKKVLAALVVLVALGVAHHYGVLSTFAEPARIKESLIGLGAAGQLAFVGAYTLLQPFGIPGTVFVMAAPLIWPWPVAFALSMAGTMAASVVGFSFARFVGRDFFRDRVFTRFSRYGRALEERGFSTVFLLRLIFWMPQWLHVALGVSSVRFSTHFWASLAGYALPIFLVSYFGQALFDWLRALPPSAWGGTAAVTVAAVALFFWVRRRRPPLGADPFTAPEATAREPGDAGSSS
jgi:uncharacterized membrane protein YdjX (TVP38/TMEM64 family)